VIVGAAKANVVAVLGKLNLQRFGVLDHLLDIHFERRCRGLFECHSHGGDVVHVRPALEPGEHGLVYDLGELLLA